jgi:nitrate/nitrite transporter NarK
MHHSVERLCVLLACGHLVACCIRLVAASVLAKVVSGRVCEPVFWLSFVVYLVPCAVFSFLIQNKIRENYIKKKKECGSAYQRMGIWAYGRDHLAHK